MSDPIMQTLHDEARLAVLRELALIDSPAEPVFDRLTELASQVMQMPISMMSIIGSYQYLKSRYGIPNEFDRQGPLSHSFCKHVALSGDALIVPDAREHPVVKDNPAIEAFNLKTYLGMPVTMRDGTVLGSFCVLGQQPHDWSETEIAIMQNLAAIISNEIDLRAQANADPQQQPRLKEMHQRMEALIDSLDPDQSQADFLANLQTARARFGL